MQYKRADLDHHLMAEQATDPIYLERWAAMYNLLATIPDDARFNMNTWGRNENTLCGTAACAAGHAMLHPWFRDRGIMDTESEGTGIEFTTKPNGDVVAGWMDFDHYEWFGFENDDFDCPFNPDFCEDVINFEAEESYHLSPVLVSEVVRAWMLAHWAVEAVDAAIEKTKDVQYSIDAVHMFTPWNNPAAIHFVKTVQRSDN